MKAVRIHEHGGREVLRVDDIPEPEINRGEVLVKVKAASLNHLDLWVRNGMKGLKIPLPLIMGSDCAGVIEKTGDGVVSLTEGDHVVVQPAYGCGRCRWCLSGREHYCRDYRIRGELTQGVQTEYVSVPENDVVKISSELDFAEAAGGVLVFLTAYEMLYRKAVVKPGETVLVMGASSGIGTSAMQLAKLAGAKVIAVTSSDWKMEKLRLLEPDYVLPYNDNLYKEVKNITEGRGADVVVEHVGKVTWIQSLRSLAVGGRIVTCGATTGAEVSFDLRHLFIKQQRIMGSTMGSKGDLFNIVRLLEDKRIQSVIHSVLPLSEIREAHRILEEKQHFGKVILEVN